MNKAAASLARKYHQKGLKAAEIKSKLYAVNGMDVSISAVYNWIRKRKSSASFKTSISKRRPGRPAVLAKLTRQILLNAALVSRYDFNRLMSVIGPFVGMLQQIEGTKSQVSEKTLKRYWDSSIKSKLIVAPLKNPPRAGTVVLHGIPIRWRQGEVGTLKRGFMLCIVERYTGFTYFCAYTQIKHESLYKRINLFADKYQAPIHKIVMTTRAIESSDGKKRVSTIMRVPYDEFCQHLENDRDVDAQNIKVVVTAPSEGKPTTIVIPGSYDGIDHLNKYLVEIADCYNKTQRLPQGKIIQIKGENYCPRARLWSLVSRIEFKDFNCRKTFVKRSRFYES